MTSLPCGTGVSRITCASGIATLIVDRDYRKVLTQSDRAVVLQKGSVVLSGDSGSLRHSEELASYLGV